MSSQDMRGQGERREPFDMALGGWVRCDRYEVRDGYIRPVQGSKWRRYDPWADFRAARSRQWTEERPYQSLLALIENLRPDAIASWCAQHGLLGVLLAETDMVALDPVEENPEEAPGRLSQVRYFRTNVGWEKYTRPTDVGAAEGWLGPGITIQHLGQTKWLQEPFSTTWARFFPNVPENDQETYQYPSPTSLDFWRLYAEPVEDFIGAAIKLRDVLDILGRVGRSPGITAEDRSRIARGQHWLHALVSRVSPAIFLTEDNGGLAHRWVSTSLLGSFAMMALLDLTERRRLLRCEVCETQFFTTSPKARYCSKRCRHTAQKRRQRAKRNHDVDGN